MESMLKAGLDWAKEVHALCVIDERGKAVLQIDVQHTAEGLAKMTQCLARLAPSTELPIAIERPSGLLIDVLVDAGHPVVPIHPNILKATRSRYRAAGGKSDPGDAFILADLLRTDGHRFERLKPASDEIRALRALVRGRDDLVGERVAIANQLRSLLESFWPGAAQVFAEIDSPISLAFLDKYPQPSAADKLGPKRLAAFLKQNGYSGRREPEQLLLRLRTAPAGLAGALELDCKAELVHAYVDVLRCLVAKIRSLSAQIEHAVAELPAGQVIMSFPRAGKINAAQILAELGDEPARFPSEQQLAAEAGVAPVTYASGKHRGVIFRFACNKRLRRALTTFADNSRHASSWARAIYGKARARGCDHPHAIRILARAWVRVIWKAWTDGTAYQVAKHGAAAALVPTEQAA
jgi:transposase